MMKQNSRVEKPKEAGKIAGSQGECALIRDHR